MATLPHVFCTECGTKNRSKSRFCFTCGYQLQKKVILHSKKTSTDAVTQPFVQQQKKLKNAPKSNINPIKSLKETTDTNTIKSESNISHQQTQIIETQTQSETIKTANPMTQTTVTETAITASDTSVDPNTLKKDETQGIEDHKEDTKHTEIKLNQEEDKEEKQPDDIKTAESRATHIITTNNNNNALCDCYGSAKGCRYGVKCTFSHSNPNSIPFCQFFNIKWNAGCPYGDECKFRHQTYGIKAHVQTRGYYRYPRQMNANAQYGYYPQRVQSGGGQYGYYQRRNEVRTYRGYQPQARRPYQTGGQQQQRQRLETGNEDGYRSWYNYPPIRT